MLRPAADWELASILADASASGSPIEIVGGHTKAEFGRPRSSAATVSTHVLRGIRAYDPSERIITIQAGCLIADVERELAAQGQMFAFEPIDVASVFGNEAGRMTIGGVIASNLAGARRIAAGGIRDNLLGVKAVAGTGDVIQSGGAAAGSNSGINLTRILAGSWGTLAALVEVSLRVAPIPKRTETIIIPGLSEEIAIEAMSHALQSPCEVTGTVHLELPMAGRLWLDELRIQGQPITALRLEYASAAGADRLKRLREALQPYGEMQVLETELSQLFWHELRQLSVLAHSDKPLWRIATLPTKAFGVVTAIRRYMSVDAFYDWSGGLIWLEVPVSADAGATEIRRVIAASGGHATLVRAPDEVKSSIDVFEPMHSGVELMSKRLKQIFDPAGIMSPGRLYADL